MPDNAAGVTREALLEWLRRETPHNECEDCWYSCSTICCDEKRRSDKCDCGADKENAMKAAALASVTRSESVHWIKNSLPQPGVAVLAWWDFVQEKGTPTETNFAIAVYNGHYWHAADDDEDDYRDPIAWMRLPEKP